MKMNSYKLLFLFGITILSSCSNNSSSDLIEPIPFVENVTYLENIKPIIESNCIVCHSSPPQNFAPMQLTTYNDVKLALQNRGLIGRITRDEGASGLMPNGGPKLPQSKIDLIIKWRDQGLQE